MPRYEEVNIDERGPEPVIRLRTQVFDESEFTDYALTLEDVERVHHFALESIALKFFNSEDLVWIITDVNDELRDPLFWQIGTVVKIPRNWDRISKAGRKTQPTGRARPPIQRTR